MSHFENSETRSPALDLVSFSCLYGRMATVAPGITMVTDEPQPPAPKDPRNRHEERRRTLLFDFARLPLVVQYRLLRPLKNLMVRIKQRHVRNKLEDINVKALTFQKGGVVSRDDEASFRAAIGALQ